MLPKGFKRKLTTILNISSPDLKIDNKGLFLILIVSSALLEVQFHKKTNIKRENRDEKNIFCHINHFICICLQQRHEPKASTRI